ncbi:6-phosphogluconate dehydrogenase (decarboxylating), gnd [Lactococcus cremoris]|jgi:6-phosphogluconate dehydrogenase|uniref:6-phosphogluconate dehydrogenase (Decarboxylating), gnd n=3 Tax=Lactococcus lactis subsp. cremoris TaxID=1359 RepID=A0A0M2ZSY6_LACLC|nr:decarboxylating 6-phosphogluconate dehydrogenase [Lactococcus cremoris]AGV74181.1 6-phosphogluconate dehydrogenase-like protein [Lactococcus cremoris subsp. cremoris KW2]KEY61988.1 GntZ protein [Lactococcus cremoris subsp. cremoris GE214]KKW69432.1 6-phosphogluconate dehydrogenase (decarboxylating), gnd [Lactococcus cremoris]KKW70337.1 6-phosphogluconate dehydrogenase (decarboxylating), gnd [Lactococcus cremoris]KZK07255.1 6-phosphogluconate dehydrogenase decarboxylating [Lactococcus cremor
MKFGMIGLGKMGMNLVKNAVDHEIEVVAYDVNAEAVEEAGNYSEKITAVKSIDELLTELSEPKIIWLMLPAGKATNSTIELLSEKLSAADILIDGGNSNYKDNLEQNKLLTEKGIKFFDVGTSGGMAGARQGGNFMIGGDDENSWSVIEPIFKAISTENGYLYTGKLGSGHYLKMIHNGIEYGMMQAIAEGFEILEQSPFDYDYEAVAKLWNHGSVIRSWLMELAQDQFSKDPKLDQIIGRVQSSGEGKWTIEESLDLGVPAPVIALSLMMRQRSLQEDTMTGKVVAALRNGFGGHEVEQK